MIRIEQIAVVPRIAFGIVFGTMAAVAYRKKRAKLALCHRTFGDVVEVKEETGPKGSVARIPVIRYKAANGEDVTFESEFGSSMWNVKTGDRLEILVSPDKPKDAEVVGFMAQWGLSLVFAVVSAGSLMGAAVFYLILKR